MIERKMHELGAGYVSEVDTVDERAWYRTLREFDDANIYQTWAYDAVRCGREHISHLLVKRNGDIAAIAQSRIIKLPFVDVGIAYVRWGPLWRRRDAGAHAETFRQAIRALRNEYVCRRGLVVRLFPLLFDDGSGCFASILKDEGFSWRGRERRDRTILVDLSRQLRHLREGLRPQWRRNLRIAERSGFEVIEGGDDELFEMFSKMYEEMVSRKGFVKPDDLYDFKVVQRRLPREFKTKIMLCRSGKNLCAGLVCSAIGNTAIYLFGATSDIGVKTRGASHLLHWKLIEWLKENDVAVYDLNGVNPVGNPGTYRFKNELCGENGRDVYFLGRFDSYPNVLGYSCVAGGDRLRALYRALGNARRAGLALLDPRCRRRELVGYEHDAGNGQHRGGGDDHREAAAEAGGRLAPAEPGRPRGDQGLAETARQVTAGAADR